MANPKKSVSKSKKAKKSNFLSSKIFISIIVVLLFAAVASYFLTASQAAAVRLASIEAEKFSLASNAAVFDDSQASGGKAVRVSGSATITTNVTLYNQSSFIEFYAKGASCRKSKPLITVNIDGQQVSSQRLSNGWASYTVSKQLNIGTHDISIKLDGSRQGNCIGDVFFDVIHFNGDIAAPQIQLSATQTTITSGSTTQVTWKTTNATSCTGTNALSGSQPLANTITTPALTANTTYGLTCTGAGGTATSAVTVTVQQSTTGTQPTTTISPSGQSMPLGSVTSGGHTWKQVFAEDFTKSAALGSWASDCDANKIVYTGATGTQWRAYPKCYLDTYQKRPYRSDAVLSVHDGMLDYWLHTVDGRPAGANPSPVMPNGSQYQTYGRYEARIKQTTTNLSHYHQAWLLWPMNDADWQCAETDFPESSMNSSNANAYAHYGCNGAQDYYSKTLDKTQWHTYTMEWLPGKRNFYIDGILIGTTTNQVWSGPQRWQLQTETNTSCESSNTCTQSGNLLVDWVTVYSYQ
jgi:hypothetical protein